MSVRVVPWMTDDSVGFMCGFADAFVQRHKTRIRVLEFGMGSSTLFFAPKASELVSFENDVEWHGRIVDATRALGWGSKVRANLCARPYSTAIAGKAGQARFNLISIDGRDRMACLEEVLKLDLLAQDGIIVIDNTERISGYNLTYRRTPEILTDFNLIHFEQIGRDRAGWQAGHRWITTVAWSKNGAQYTSKGTLL